MSSTSGHLDGRWGAWFAAWVLSLASAVASDHSAAWISRAWQTDDGLPNNDVTAIAQAADGAMLFGTRSGLSRFDGLRLQNVPIGEDLRGPRGVNGMIAGHDGALWLISGGRLVVLRKNQPPRSFPLPNVPADPHVSAMLEHPRGMLWICFENGPLMRIDIAATEAAGTVAAPPLDGARLMPALAKDSANGIWVADSGALLRGTGEKLETVASLPPGQSSLCAAGSGGLWLGIGRQLLRHTVTGCVEVACLPPGPPGSRASTLLEDRQGRVWFGTFGDGLHVWDGVHFSRVELPSRDIWCLQADREGNLWAGTGGGGVCRVRPRVLAMLEESDAPAALTPRSLCADRHGDIWVALQTGKLYRRHAGRWQQLEDGRDWPAAFATCVAADAGGQVWISTSNGELVRWNGHAFEKVPLPPARGHGRIRALLVARNGEVWLGHGHVLLHGRPGNWQELLDPKRLAPQEIQVLTQDPQGQVWAGMRNGVLLLATPTNLVQRTPPELVDCGQIRSLLATPDGALWIGTVGGLARLKNGRCRMLTTAHGLRHNVVSQLLLGPHDRLWAAGDRGIFFAALDELNAVAEGRAASFQCIALGSGEGAPGLQANSGYSPNALRAPDGRIWFATRSGIAIADPTFCGANTIPPPVAIAEMFVDDRAVALPQTRPVPVEAGAAEIRFTLSAMSYVAPENVRLRHRLDGADTAWQDSAADRTVTYSHLSPGRYTLRMRAANNDGVWSTRDATLAFTVLPFFHQRAWFRFAVAAAGLAAAALAAYLAAMRRLRRRTEALERAAALDRERTRIARDMHDQLGASLTQISLLSELAQADGPPSPHLPRLAATTHDAVTALDAIVWAVNPRHDNLASLLEYIGQQSVDLLQSAGIGCRLDFPKTPPARPLDIDFRHHVFLLVREAVNNAAKHSGATEVRVTVETPDSGLRLSIADNGRGFDVGAATGGNGLASLRARAAELGGECDIRSQPGAGADITVRVPWPRNSMPVPIQLKEP